MKLTACFLAPRVHRGYLCSFLSVWCRHDHPHFMEHFRMEGARSYRQFGCTYLVRVHPSQVHQRVLASGVLRDMDDYRCHADWNTSCCYLCSKNTLWLPLHHTHVGRNGINNPSVDEGQLLSGKSESIWKGVLTLWSLFGSLCFTSWKNLNIYSFNW